MKIGVIGAGRLGICFALLCEQAGLGPNTQSGMNCEIRVLSWVFQFCRVFVHLHRRSSPRPRLRPLSPFPSCPYHVHAPFPRSFLSLPRTRCRAASLPLSRPRLPFARDLVRVSRPGSRMASFTEAMVASPYRRRAQTSFSLRSTMIHFK